MNRKRIFSEVVAFLVFFALVGGYLYGRRIEGSVPEIVSITPELGSSGDVLQIDGGHFGSRKLYDCSVSIGDRSFSPSDYLLWQDDKIRIKLSDRVKSGLLCVETGSGVSNSVLFTNIDEIPIPEASMRVPTPYISEISAIRPDAGDTITIRGSGFGSDKGSGFVLFQENEADDLADGIAEDLAYELWSDTEIKMHVPDGASDVSICVVTESGKSNLCHLERQL